MQHPRAPISAGDLTVKLYERWGGRWLVDRLLALANNTETDWLEFKATMCPPISFFERYSDSDRGSKYVKGDYYLNVVKSLVSMLNSHGGAVLVGVAQQRGKPPLPSDYDRLCEADEYAPTPLDQSRLCWDTDKWLLYVRNVLRTNEWVDRYGTIWNSSVILEDPVVRLFNGFLHGRPVIVIAAFPVLEGPVELMRLVPVGRPHTSEKRPAQCKRRAQDGGSCHWPHEDPHPIQHAAVPVRLSGDIAAVELKWSIAGVTQLWKSREARQERFGRMAEDDGRDLGTHPYGLLCAVDSVLSRIWRSALSAVGVSESASILEQWEVASAETGERPLRSLLDAHHQGMVRCLTGSTQEGRTSAVASLCIECVKTHMWGKPIVVPVRLADSMDSSALRHLLTVDPDRYILAGLLPFIGGPATRQEHWQFLALAGCVHIIVEGVESIPKPLVSPFARAVNSFRHACPHSCVTLVTGQDDIPSELRVSSRLELRCPEVPVVWCQDSLCRNAKETQDDPGL